MDRVEYYREIVRGLITEYAQYKPSHGQIETEAIMHGSVVHIDIIDRHLFSRLTRHSPNCCSKHRIPHYASRTRQQFAVRLW